MDTPVEYNTIIKYFVFDVLKPNQNTTSILARFTIKVHDDFSSCFFKQSLLLIIMFK